MRQVETVMVKGEDGVDPNLLLLDGRDIRTVSRRERRKHGFRGPAFTQSATTLARYVRRHYVEARPVTRRQRKVRSRIRRAVAARGLA